MTLHAFARSISLVEKIRPPHPFACRSDASVASGAWPQATFTTASRRRRERRSAAAVSLPSILSASVAAASLSSASSMNALSLTAVSIVTPIRLACCAVTRESNLLRSGGGRSLEGRNR